MTDAFSQGPAASALPLLQVLGALDLTLAAAIERTHAIRPNATADPFRGLHIDPADIESDMARRPGEALHAIGCDAIQAVVSFEPRLATLADAYGLSPFEISSLLLALAPDVDARYERIYAYLQDDVTRKRPTAALALDLFSGTREDRLQCARSLAHGSTLFREHLLQARSAGALSMLSAPIFVDSQIARHLLGSPGFDPALADWCSLLPAGSATMPPWLLASDAAALHVVARELGSRRAPVVLHLHGAHGTGKFQTARALSALAQRPLLVADLRGALGDNGGFTRALRRVVREAVLQQALLYLRGYDSLVETGERQALRALSETLADAAATAVISARHRWQDAAAAPLNVVEITSDCADTGARARSWRAALENHAIAADDEAIDLLAGRFRLRPAQVEAAVGTACARQQWSTRAASLESRGPSLGELARAARRESGHALATLARRIAPRSGWADLVVPPPTLAVLHEIRDRVTHRERVMTAWGFDARLSLGKGVSVLLAGPSGTGKTLAAEVLAADLGLDLFRIDLSRVVSKYIGETEQNLDRVFDAAVDANAVLLFDEAEALFGKRSEVHDAHDRYANLEIAYLLQKIEEFDGLALLSTNLRQNIDEAFTRRLAFTVHFPFPEEESRTRIWEIVWPRETPRASDVDPAFFGRELVLSGGNIKNAALAAAFYAAADGGVVTRAHVLRAAGREFQKMGKVPAAPEAAA